MKTYLDFNDVLIRPGFSEETITRKDVNILRNGRLPIIVSNMIATGTFEMAAAIEEFGGITFLSKEYSVSECILGLQTVDKDLIGLTTGVRDRDIKRLLEVLATHPDVAFVNIDIANVGAQLAEIRKAIEIVRDNYSGIIVAGNVATPEIALKLQEYGADVIKVGIGSGSACLTRTEVGVGVPQFSAILEIAECVNVPIISDGGCVTPGDVCKAIAAGADYVMLGGMFSGCVELSDSDTVDFYGLGSKKMYDTYNPTDKEYRPVEGRTLQVPVTTTVAEVATQLMGALRSTCTYVGVDDIKDLSNKAQFIKVNRVVNTSLERYE